MARSAVQILTLLCALMMCWAPKAAAQDGKSHEDRIPAEAAHGKRAGQADLCRDGRAAGYPCEHVHLLSFLPLHELGAGPGIGLNDAWGWVDPETGQRWALVGREDGVAFVEISDPAVPRYAGQLPMPSTAQANVWRDIKVDGWYAFIVADGSYSRQGLHGMQVFDLRRLRQATALPVTFDADAHYTEFNVAHNVVVNEETNRAYVVGARLDQRSCNGGLHIIDISSPLQPEFAGCFADAGTGRQGGGYVHDAQCIVYRGPDWAYHGREICVGSNETAISIADVTDADNPSGIARGTYPSASYVHQGWFTEDQRYFIQNDELDERVFDEQTHTYIWDLEDLDDPVLLVDFVSDAVSTDHNLYVRDDFVYQANYSSGLRILDISDPSKPFVAGYFDTRPDDSAVNFNGAWTAWPYPDDDLVIISSRGEGLFVVRPGALLGVRFTGMEGHALDDGALELRWSINRPSGIERYDVLQLDPDGASTRVASLAAPVGSGQISSRLAMGEGVFRFRIVAVDQGGEALVSDDIVVNTLAGTHLLDPIWPNPASTMARARLAVSRSQAVHVTLHDALGRELMPLFEGFVSADDARDIGIDVRRLAPGLHYIHVVGQHFSETRSFVVTR